MTPWWKSRPTPEIIAAEIQVQELKKVREIRKSLFTEIMEKIDRLPLVDGIEGIGRDLAKRGK